VRNIAAARLQKMSRQHDAMTLTTQRRYFPCRRRLPKKLLPVFDARRCSSRRLIFVRPHAPGNARHDAEPQRGQRHKMSTFRMRRPSRHVHMQRVRERLMLPRPTTPPRRRRDMPPPAVISHTSPHAGVQRHDTPSAAPPPAQCAIQQPMLVVAVSPAAACAAPVAPPGLCSAARRN